MLQHHFLIPHLHFSFFSLPAFMAGIIAAYYHVESNLLFLITGLALIMLLTLHTIGYSWAKTSLSFIVLFLAGAYACYHQQTRHELFQTLIKNNTVDVHALVNTIETIVHPYFKYKMHATVQKIKIQEQPNWASANNSIIIYLLRLPSAQVADVIHIRQLHSKGIDNAAYNLYLAKEKVSSSFFIQKLDFSLIHRPVYSIQRALFAFQQHLLTVSRMLMSKETFALFCSIFLGNRTESKKVMETKKELFKVWGVSHYLARSGLHLVIFTMIWHFILSMIPLSFFYKQIILILLILFYTLFSWNSISFERALYIFFIFKLCLLSSAPSNYVHLIALTTLIILICNPLQLFFIDFQLSCGLTLALAWFNSVQHHKKRLS